MYKVITFQVSYITHYVSWQFVSYAILMNNIAVKGLGVAGAEESGAGQQRWVTHVILLKTFKYKSIIPSPQMDCKYNKQTRTKTMGKTEG
jgi:hypothetical protein